jgi:hypothetical protein
MRSASFAIRRVETLISSPHSVLIVGILPLSRRLGYGSPTITFGIYGHEFKDTDAKAAELIEAAFGSAITE